MDRDEVRAWMARWEIVNQHTISPRTAADEEDDERVRELWMRLHAFHGTRRP